MNNFSELVKAYRGERPLREFAQVIGVSHQTVANWEAGEIRPQYFALLPLALHSQGEAKDFALDGLAALKPELYEPVTELGRNILNHKNTVAQNLNDGAYLS